MLHALSFPEVCSLATDAGSNYNQSSNREFGTEISADKIFDAIPLKEKELEVSCHPVYCWLVKRV